MPASVATTPEHATAQSTLPATTDSTPWQWLVEQGDPNNEAPERIGERALAIYRERIEGADSLSP